MEWQPIESAPKDGTVVDLHGIHQGSMLGMNYRITDCSWDFLPAKNGLVVEKDFVDRNSRKVIATHWMPLPAPPTEESK